MKRNKKLGLLSIVLLVLLLSTYGVSKIKFEEEEVAEDTALVYQLDTTSLEKIFWTYGDTTLSFAINDSGWYYMNDESFPLDSSYIDSIANYLTEVYSSKTIENVEDMSEYGLDEAACEIIINDDTTTPLLIGNESGMGGERYFSIGDGNVYLVDSSIIDYFTYNIYDYVLFESIPSMSDINSMSVSRATDTIEVKYLEGEDIAYTNDYVWFAVDDDNYRILDTELTESLISQISELSWTNCVDYKATNETLSDYGLDTPNATINISYVETTSVATDEVDDDGNIIYEDQSSLKSFVLEIGEINDEYCYARIKDSSMVYEIDYSIGNEFVNLTIDSITPEEVVLLDWNEINAISIEYNGNSYSIEETKVESTNDDGDTVTETVYMLNNEEFDISDIKTNLDSMVSAGTAYGVESDTEKIIEFIFSRNESDGGELVLSFHKYNTTYYLVKINNEAYCFISCEEADTITELVEAI